MHREQRQSGVTTKRVRQKLHVSCRYHPSPPRPRSFVPLFDLLPLGTFIIWDLTKRTAAFQLTRGLARTKDKQIQRYRCRRLQIQSGEHICMYVVVCVCRAFTAQARWPISHFFLHSAHLHYACCCRCWSRSFACLCFASFVAHFSAHFSWSVLSL